MMLAAFALRRAPALVALLVFVHAVGLLGLCRRAGPASGAGKLAPDQAIVPGLPADVRYWGDDPAAAFQRLAVSCPKTNLASAVPA